ncbi:MAG: hypothetical protein JRG80_16455 [Deltaproteobacteria bacterium]|nr:hypothetical protein [Deltaproteobacteria bacterium]
MHRANRYPDKSQDVCCSPVGQIVGRMNQPQSSRQVLMKLVEEYLDAVERLNSLQPCED